MRRILTTVSAAAFAATLSPRALASSAITEAAPSAVAIEVDVSALPDDKIAQRLSAWVHDEAQKALAEAEIVVDEGAATRVSISVRRYGEHDVHTEVSTGVASDDTTELRAARTLACERCTDTEVIEKISSDMIRLAGWLARDAEPEEGSPPPPTGQPPPSGEPEVAPPPPDDKRIGNEGIAGAVLTGSGVAAIVAGSIVLSRGHNKKLDATADSVQVREPRPLGIGILAAGGVALVVGLPLLLVDVVPRARRRRSKKNTAATLRVSPTWLRGPAFTFTGAF